jgi:hypothetical protein
MRRSSAARRKLRLLPCLAAGITIISLGMAGVARAGDDDGYMKTNQINVPVNTISCTFSPTLTTSTPFSFDISWVAQARGEYLLAERSHGRPSHDTEGGRLSGATSGDLLLINTDDPGAGPSYILPPRNDPFAGHRCDINADFGGVISGPPGHQNTRNEIEGPNGVFTVNDTEAWVGDGPSYFTPGQTDSAADYKSDPCDSSVRVFSLITRRQIDHINVHGCFRTDEGAFDPVDQIALWANPSEKPLPGNPRARRLNNSPFITLISTGPSNGDRDHRWGDDGHRGDRHEILKQINFNGNNGTPMANGGIEQAVYSRQTGLFYIAVPGNSTNPDGFVTTVDPRHGHFGEVHTYALPSNSCDGGPAGAALGPNYELLLGCGGFGGEVVVRDIRTLASPITNATILPDGSSSCDEVAYDAGSGHFGGACFTTAPGQFDVLVNDARSLQFDVNIPNTQASGAHSIAADSVNEQFWVPKFGGDCGNGVDCVAVYHPTASDDFGDPTP